MENIIVSIIGGIVAIVVALIGLLQIRKKQDIANEVMKQQFSDNFKEIFRRFDETDKRLDEHNHYAEKITGVTIDIATIKKDIEYLKSR